MAEYEAYIDSGLSIEQFNLAVKGEEATGAKLKRVLLSGNRNIIYFENTHGRPQNYTVIAFPWDTNFTGRNPVWQGEIYLNNERVEVVVY